MDWKGVSGSHLALSDEDKESLYPVFFGVSCAFLALRILSDERWSEIKNGISLGSAHLVGLLVWKVQKEESENCKSELLKKLENAQKEIEELKKRRSEDAKANEKVVGIFAAQEQSWFSERKKLRQHVGALINELRVREAKAGKATYELNEKLRQSEVLLKSKDKVLEEEEQKRKDLEEKLQNLEDTLAELGETAKQETQRHSVEMAKHKTAFIELVSNQRQLEAEMSRALRQFELAKQERDSVLEQKEQSAMMAQKLSMELVKMRRDLEQKDQILSAMLRKSKLDTAERQMLLDEVKLSKAKKKQAELVTERSKGDSEPRRERHSLRSMLSRNANSKADSRRKGGAHSNAMAQSNMERHIPNQSNILVEYERPETRVGREASPPALDQYISEGIQDLTDFKHVEVWVRSQAEKYITTLEQKHHFEVDAFAEQLRGKDERLEAFRWRLLSMELETKRLQSHAEVLENDLTQLRRANMKLEALLSNREAELHSIKDKFALLVSHCTCQKTSSNPCDLSLSYDTIWSKVKVVKRKPTEKERETKETNWERDQVLENEKVDETSANNHPKDIVLTLQPPFREVKERYDLQSPDSIQEESISGSQEVDSTESSSSQISGKCFSNKSNNTSWKLDLHALGLSYKIKRLKQQLLMLERLAGKQESLEDGDGNGNARVEAKGVYMLMALLHKQINRYHSLQGKTDDLCERMVS
ncbi:OLC1v1027869C2 [Oldenlandia corymbosa var. corymbosa]|uniref:OLC1v1027869C2 n=1 Tax=Oldenlandia corymbosa var. corymbosa TaxID=529605 RepID=A0AAV1CAY8_OLDCO|nr:OLC1v1027869C2 [Oldenlandia corymbosa var. corymbosa]